MAFLTKLRDQAGAAAHTGAKADDAHKPFMERLRASAGHASDEEHPWLPILRKIRGRIGPDQIERVSTKDTFDALLVPMKKRPNLTLQLSWMMRELGWSNIRAWGLNDQCTLSRVRGFARPAPGSKALM